ncbi:ClpX C4-type zinc finger protein [Enterobacter mori]
MSGNNIYKCSFCGVTEQQAKRIIAKGRKDEAAICSDCVVQCVSVIANLASISTLEERETIEAAPIQGGEKTANSIQKAVISSVIQTHQEEQPELDQSVQQAR